MATRRRPRAKPQPQPLEHQLLLTATFCLLAAGAVMVYSASSARTLLQHQGDGTGYLIKYVAYGAVGLVALKVVARLDLGIVRRFTPLLLAGAFVLLVLVLMPGFGVHINGARRWLGFGPLQFQPSEIMKLALVAHTAATLSARPKLVRNLRTVIGPIGLPAGCAVLLIFAQPDLGTALVVCFTLMALLVIAGLPLKQLAVGIGIGASLIMLFAILEPYRRARLTAFVNPWADHSTIGYQAVQGQIAIGSGGIFGHGLGQSIQKVDYLPEAHTDFILAVIGEELGLAGICAVLLLYGMIGYAGLRTAKNARTTYAKLLAGGLTALVLCQALLNVYAVLGLAPLTGVPLPFISSGSTSLIVMLCTMGLLLNVASGGDARLRAVPQPNTRRSEDERERTTEDRDRRRGNGGARGPGDRRRRRAAG